MPLLQQKLEKTVSSASADPPLRYAISCSILHRSIAAYAQTFGKRTTTSEGHQPVPAGHTGADRSWASRDSVLRYQNTPLF